MEPKEKKQVPSASGVPDIRDLIRKRWQEKASSGEIALELGMTRNAVIGHVNRGRELDGIEAWPSRSASYGGAAKNNHVKALRKAPSRVKPKAAPPERKQLRPAYVPRKPVKTHSGKPILLVDIKSGQCHFPLWDSYTKPTVEQMFYCGAPTDYESVWCDSCKGIVFAEAKPGRARARV